MVSRSRSGEQPVPFDRAAKPSLALVVRGGAARRGLSALLEKEFRLAATSSTPNALIERCGESQPDAVVIKLHVNGHGSILALRRLREALPDTRIVVITDPGREHDVRRAFRAGADGVVFASEVDRALAPTVRAVLAGQLSLPSEHRRQLEKRALSYREQQVLGLVISGATNRQAADALVLAESTVKGHLASAFAKLGVRSRAEAAAVLLDPEAEPGHTLPLALLTRDPGEFSARPGPRIAGDRELTSPQRGQFRRRERA
jgi:DNA-binding NarL/FixJ family response regulator